MFGPARQNTALRICIWATTESDRRIASKILWTSGQSLFISVDDLLSRSWAGVVVWCLVFSECQEALQPDECLLFAGDPLAQNSEGSRRRKVLI